MKVFLNDDYTLKRDFKIYFAINFFIIFILIFISFLGNNYLSLVEKDLSTNVMTSYFSVNSNLINDTASNIINNSFVYKVLLFFPFILIFLGLDIGFLLYKGLDKSNYLFYFIINLLGLFSLYLLLKSGKVLIVFLVYRFVYYYFLDSIFNKDIDKDINFKFVLFLALRSFLDIILYLIVLMVVIMVLTLNKLKFIFFLIGVFIYLFYVVIRFIVLKKYYGKKDEKKS